MEHEISKSWRENIIWLRIVNYTASSASIIVFKQKKEVKIMVFLSNGWFSTAFVNTINF